VARLFPQPLFILVPGCHASLAMSVPTILMVSRCQVSRFQSPQRYYRVLYIILNGKVLYFWYCY